MGRARKDPTSATSAKLVKVKYLGPSDSYVAGEHTLFKGQPGDAPEWALAAMKRGGHGFEAKKQTETQEKEGE